MFPSVTSFVPGPIDPITKRGLSAVEWRSHAARATSAARLLSSYVQLAASSSNSARTSLFEPNESVSTQSAPTARNDSWIPWMMSGLDFTRMSVQLSRPR
ncbi:MAG: hypothetical protein U0575_16620 [Phycisphaerales bacterium]